MNFSFKTFREVSPTPYMPDDIIAYGYGIRKGRAQNFLVIDATEHAIAMRLHVYNATNGASSEKDQTLSIRPDQGHDLITGSPTG